MTKEYVDNMKKEAWDKVLKAKDILAEAIRSANLPADLTEHLIGIAENEMKEHSGLCSDLDYEALLAISDFYKKKIPDDREARNDAEDKACSAIENIKPKFGSLVTAFKDALRYANDCDFEDYLDTEPIEFDGTIIITDPGYIVKEWEQSPYPNLKDFLSYEKEEDYPDYDPEELSSEKFGEDFAVYQKAIGKWNEDNPREWEQVAYGAHMERIGLSSFISRRTLYGDWSCTTFNLGDKDTPFGEFCADSGQVGVFLLDEVLRNNPKFDYHTERTWTTTLIEDFKGTVQLLVTAHSHISEKDTSWVKKGETWIDWEVNLEGHGINKVTGQPINFRTEQTGF